MKNEVNSVPKRTLLDLFEESVAKFSEKTFLLEKGMENFVQLPIQRPSC